jgi:hypothetical protein
MKSQMTASAWAQGPSQSKEPPGPGSGSTGQAPQQGTGSGSSQVAPDANKQSVPHGQGADTKQNRYYGRDIEPKGQDLTQGQSDRPKP